MAQKIKAVRANVEATIDAKIEELIGNAPYLDGESLFVLPAGAERKKRVDVSSGKLMGRLALWAIEYRARHNEIDEEEAERVLELAQQVVARRAARGVQGGLF